MKKSEWGPEVRHESGERSQVGFSATMGKIKSVTFFERFFPRTCLLAVELKLQYRRKPVLCQRTKVSGVPRMTDWPGVVGLTVT